jgi:antitoxin component YwqK of YwqJK toxin-antitoxin module
MKNIICLLSFFLIVITGYNQEYKYAYYFDANLNFVSKEKAVAIGKAYEQNGLIIMDCFGIQTGKMIFSSTFKDSSLQVMHGLHTSYYEDDFIETQGEYNESEMDGLWKTWDKYGLITDSVFYHKGLRTAYGKYKYVFNKNYRLLIPTIDSIKKDGYILIYSFTDSLKNTFYEHELTLEKGIEKLNFESRFIGNTGLLKEYDSTGNVTMDSVFDRKLVDAEFPGGDDDWRRFLQKNLNVGIASDNRAPNGNHTVIIRFAIDINGNVTDVDAEDNPGYGIVQEGIRVIKLSPKWRPAKKYGRRIKSYRRQPMTFIVDNG